MITMLLLFVLYFLPAILGRNKQNATGILLLNLFFGWTGIGWIIAFLWACAADRAPNYYLLPAVAGGRYCCNCGSATCHGAHFCARCGNAV